MSLTKRTASPLAWARKSWLSGLVASLYLMTAGIAFAGAPPVGTTIGNQAVVTFVDADSVSRTVYSNEVKTTVTQIFTVDLDNNIEKLGNPGSTVYLPHVLTNKGNGPDTFAFAFDTIAGTGATFPAPVLGTNLFIYQDTNGDGQPDGAALTSTPTVNGGETFKFVVAVTIPGGAAAADTATYNLTATSAGTGTPSDVITGDQVTVTTGAVVEVSKALSVTSGPSPNTSDIWVTYTIKNTSTTNATAVTLTDTLPNGMVYTAATGVYSPNTFPVSDAADGVEANGGTYGINYSVSGQAVSATMSLVSGTTEQTLKFKVTIAGSLTNGTVLNSAASYDWNDNPGANKTTNAASYTVGGGDTLGVMIDDQSLPSVLQGQPATFTNTVTNTGERSDTYNITFSANTFPVGTVFQLLNAGGTPLLDSNGDNIPDTAVVAGGGTIPITVKATPPASATGGPYTVTVKATSVAAPLTVSDTGVDTLTDILPSTVDVAAAPTTYNVAAGQCVTMPFTVTDCDMVPPDEDSDWVGPITWTLDGQLRSGAEGKLKYQVQVDQ